MGGTSVHDNTQTLLSTSPQIAIGTPGRILDLINRQVPCFNLKSLEILILDEADSILDLGFKDTINQILSVLPKQRRTGLFSATQTNEVKELARAGLRNPVTIVVKVQAKEALSSSSSLASAAPASHQLLIPSTLTNHFEICDYEHRIPRILHFMHENPASKIIVFCATCSCVDFYSLVFARLTSGSPSSSSSSSSSAQKTASFFKSNHQVVGLHGKMVPKKRTALYRKFVAMEAGVLFSTDVAARGTGFIAPIYAITTDNCFN